MVRGNKTEEGNSHEKGKIDAHLTEKEIHAFIKSMQCGEQKGKECTVQESQETDNDYNEAKYTQVGGSSGNGTTTKGESRLERID